MTLCTLNHRSYKNNRHGSQLPLGKWYLFKFTIPSCSVFEWAEEVRFCPAAIPLALAPWGHRPVPRGWAGPACWSPRWAPGLCLRMWKKPGTGPRSASQNYITIIPLSMSEASRAPAQSRRKVGEGWQWAGLWLKNTVSGSHEMVAYLHLYLSLCDIFWLLCQMPRPTMY